MQCQKHPTYQAKLTPRAACRACEALFYMNGTVNHIASSGAKEIVFADGSRLKERVEAQPQAA